MKIWVLNLDAEIELARAGPYQAPARVLRALEPWLARARSLLGPDDLLLEEWIGGQGRSINVYDRAAARWTQLYVFASGGASEL